MIPLHRHNAKKSKASQLEVLTEAEERLVKAFIRSQKKVSKKFPFWTALGATIGVILVFSSLQKLINQIDFLVDNPWVMLITGLVILGVTGSLYRKL